MKTLHYSIIVLSLAGLFIGASNSVYAPCLVGVTSCGPPPGVTVSTWTDSPFYEKNDTINFQGRVYVQNYSKPIEIDVKNPNGTTIQSSTVTITNDTFGLKINANFDTTGLYSIVTCVQSWCDRSYFKYVAEPYKITANGGDYFIKYKSSADLVGIDADMAANALRVHVASGSSGKFVIELPRALIDSQEYDKDASFKVLVGMHQPDKFMQPANFTEIANNSLSRTLTIDIPYEPISNTAGIWDFKISSAPISGPVSSVQSPLKQFKSGVSVEDISCKEGLFLAIKSDKEPTCLKVGTISKLASRGFLYGIDANESETNYTTILIPPGSENPSSTNTYSPVVAIVVIGVNNTVQWINQAVTGNSIEADRPFEQDGKQFGSDGIIKPGQSYEFTFTEPGTFAYHGVPHPWQRGKIIVLSSPNIGGILSTNTHLITNQVHYYDSSNLHPQVVLNDYFYKGINQDGIVTINNQTYYQTTLDYTIYNLPKDTPIQFHNVTFSFPEGTLITPGGAFVTLDVKFQDGNEEIYGGTMKAPEGSGTMLGGILIPTPFGLHLATNSTTVLGNHTMPQAGITIYNDKIKLLASVGNISSEKSVITNHTIPTAQIIPSCASKISHQYAIAGPPGAPLCPVMNFQASGSILNATGFYGIYNYTEFLNTQNFVLEPGHNGTFTYEISTGSIYSWTNTPPANEINITNNLSFMHDAGMNNHPGVIVSVLPNSEMMSKNSSTLITIIFSASKDALPGTYWVTLPPGICAGGEMIILTIADCGK